MRDQAQARLELLRAELATGQTKLRELELQTLRLREVLLRLRGAIQVLEELLQPARSEPAKSQPGSPAAAERAPDQEVAPKQAGRPGTEGDGPP